MVTAASSHTGESGVLPIGETILRTLANEIGTRGLVLVRRPELEGASVVGRYFETYVYPEAEGFQVDVWRPEGDEPVRMERVAVLMDAVAVAVEAAAAVEVEPGGECRL